MESAIPSDVSIVFTRKPQTKHAQIHNRRGFLYENRRISAEENRWIEIDLLLLMIMTAMMMMVLIYGTIKSSLIYCKIDFTPKASQREWESEFQFNSPHSQLLNSNWIFRFFFCQCRHRHNAACGFDFESLKTQFSAFNEELFSWFLLMNRIDWQFYSIKCWSELKIGFHDIAYAICQ